MRKKELNNWDLSKNKEFYFSTTDSKGEILLYSSERYAMSESEFLSLIRILLVNGRCKTIGKKALAVYENSTTDRKELSEERLILIGVEKNEKEIKPFKGKRKTRSL